MLSDAQIERWSRQILLPDVGGRGQELLLAARVALGGSGAIAAGAGDLLERAGVAVTAATAPGEPNVVIDLEPDVATSAALARRAVAAGVPLVRGRLAGAAGWVFTLVGRPCGLCVAEDPLAVAGMAGPLAAPAAQALGALVAAETLAVLLAPRPRGRVQRFDLVSGECGGVELDATGCGVCGGQA
jgi:molybdopterin/thiamine biosynthesis adenylyltransferase